METSAVFARAIKARYGIESDYALAKILGVTRSTISAHKVGKATVFAEETGHRIAELLDLDAGYVLACLAAERSKDIKVKKVWQRLAELTRVAIIAPVLFAVTIAGSAFVTPSPAVASMSVYYVKLVRRWRRALALCGRFAIVYAVIRGGRRMHGSIATWAVLALLYISPAAGGEWTDTDTKWQAAYLTLHVVDWRQSYYISKNINREREANRILGENPSEGDVHRYFLATGLLHTGISYALPHPWRRRWQMVWIVVQASVVSYNYAAGIRLDF